MMGIACDSGASGDVGMLIRGWVRDISVVGTAPSGGDPMYMSTTANTFTKTPPSNSTEIVRIVGYYVTNSTDDLFWFQPDNTWIKRS